MAIAGIMEQLICGLCRNIYKTPKFLSCHHTFCKGCLDGLVKYTEFETSYLYSRESFCRSLKCPECRQDTRLPYGGVAALQENFFVTRLLDAIKHGWCNDHKKPLEYYCEECSTPLCQMCAMTEHKPHKTKDLNTVVDQAKKDLKGHEKRLEEDESKLRSHLDAIKENKKDITDRCDMLRKKVSTREKVLKQKMQEQLAACKAEADKEIRQCQRDRLATLEENEASVKSSLSTVQKLKEKLERALDGTSGADLLALQSEMTTGDGSPGQMRKLTSTAPRRISLPDLQVPDSDLPRQFTTQMFLGQRSSFTAENAFTRPSGTALKSHLFD